MTTRRDTHRRPHHVGARRPPRRRRRPTTPCSSRPTARRSPSAQFRDRAERVAAGLQGMGVTTGSVVSWQLPTRIDTVVLSIALSRLGAVQNPIIHLYREREVGSPSARPAPRCSSSPAPGGTPTSWPWPSGRWPDAATPPDHPRHRRRAPRRRPRRPAAAAPGTAPEDAPIRWIYYTSGSTADPKGVQHTDQTLIAGGWGLARALDMGPDDVGSIAFPFAHIAGPDYLVTMLSSDSRPSSSRPSPPPTSCPSSAGTAPPWSAGAPPSTWPTWPSSARRPATRSCPPCGSCPAAARPSRPRSTTRCATRSAGAASCTATA